jgi:hypothetical protein
MIPSELFHTNSLFLILQTSNRDSFRTNYKFLYSLKQGLKSETKRNGKNSETKRKIKNQGPRNETKKIRKRNGTTQEN